MEEVAEISADCEAKCSCCCSLHCGKFLPFIFLMHDAPHLNQRPKPFFFELKFALFNVKISIVLDLFALYFCLSTLRIFYTYDNLF